MSSLTAMTCPFVLTNACASVRIPQPVLIIANHLACPRRLPTATEIGWKGTNYSHQLQVSENMYTTAHIQYRRTTKTRY